MILNLYDVVQHEKSACDRIFILPLYLFQVRNTNDNNDIFLITFHVYLSFIKSSIIDAD